MNSNSNDDDYAGDGFLIVGLVTVVVVAGAVGWWVLQRLIRLAVAALRWHPWITIAAVLSVWGLVVSGPVGLAGWWAFTAALLVIWWGGHESSFNRLVRVRARAAWRREWVYRRRWRTAMFLSGLGSRFDGGEVYSKLGRVRSTGTSDLVALRLAIAQEPRDWERVAERLAQSFGALGCRVRSTTPGYVVLEFTTRRHEAVIPALPIPAVPDLEALAIGRRADGSPWELRLAQTHVLVAGATGSGKGSVVWSVIRALASAVHEGWVQLWVVDPKGGMEFAAGRPMFARFAVDTVDIADLLDDAVDLLRDRAIRLQGVTRQHTPTPDDPAIVLIVDEMGAVSSYEPSAELRRRIASSLGILTSQGRALSISMITELQDPRKEVIPLRDLFPTRVCMRTTEAEQVDWVLGRGAHDRGAVAERIPETSQGCGYVLPDGRIEPTWVRASWVSDDDIDAMVRDYPAPLPAGLGLAVVDDTGGGDGEEVAA